MHKYILVLYFFIAQYYAIFTIKRLNQLNQVVNQKMQFYYSYLLILNTK